MTTEEIPTFSTRDLYLASTLVTLKFPLIGIDLQYEGIKPRAIGFFKFADSAELKKAKGDYNQGMVTVEPRMFISNLQALKSEVAEMQQNPMSDFNRASR